MIAFPLDHQTKHEVDVLSNNHGTSVPGSNVRHGDIIQAFAAVEPITNIA